MEFYLLSAFTVGSGSLAPKWLHVWDTVPGSFLAWNSLHKCKSAAKSPVLSKWDRLIHSSRLCISTV